MRHHYVSQFHLNQFSPIPGQKVPRVWALDKSTGRIHKTAVREAAHVHGFYDLDGDDHLGAEAALGDIETAVAPILKRIVRERASLSEHDYGVLAYYVALSSTRTPGFRAAMNATGTLIAATIAADMGESFEGLSVHVTGDGATRMMFRLALEAAPLLWKNKHWTFVHFPAPILAIGDAPLTVFDPSAQRDQGVGLFSSETVEVMLPCSPSCLLMLHHRPHLPEHLDATGTAAHELAESANWRATSNASRWVYASSESLLRSIMLRHPDALQPPPLTMVDGLDDATIHDAHTQAHRDATSRHQP